MQTEQQKRNEEAINRWLERHPVYALLVTMMLGAAISLPLVWLIIDKGWTF